MNPLLRFAVVAAALAGAFLIARSAWPPLAANLAALKSWNRTEGEVRAMAGDVEFEIGQEPNSYRALAPVDHTWGLSLFHKAPLLIDPADPSHIKPAGFLQLWLTPAGMAAFLILLLAIAWMGARFGAAQPLDAPAGAQWMFTPSPGPLSGPVTLHSPPRQWKIIVAWSLLGVALLVIPLLAKGGNPVQRVAMMTLGGAFALTLWAFAWHTATLEITADDHGVRMTSVLGWRDLPWSLVRSVEDQEIFATYYNGRLSMFELPFPGSTIRVLALNDENGRSRMTFSPELVPQESLTGLFRLCSARTGLKLHSRTIAIHY